MFGFLLTSLTFLQPMALECLYPEWDYIHYGYLAMSSPFLLLAFVLLCRSLIVIVRLISGISPQRTAFWHSYFMYVWHYISIGLFTSVCFYTFSSLNCESSLSLSYLSSAPYIDCNSDRFRTYQAVGIATLLLFVVGYPLLHAIAYYRFRKAHPTPSNRPVDTTPGGGVGGQKGIMGRLRKESETTNQKFVSGFLASSQILRTSLKEGREHWVMSVILTRQAALVALPQMLPYVSVLISFTLFLVLCISIYVQLLFRPFRSETDNFIQVALLFLSAATHFARVTTLLRGVEGSETVYDIVLDVNVLVGCSVLLYTMVRYYKQEIGCQRFMRDVDRESELYESNVEYEEGEEGEEEEEEEGYYPMHDGNGLVYFNDDYVVG